MRTYRVVTAVVMVAGLGLLSGCSGSSSKTSAAFSAAAAGGVAVPAPAARAAENVHGEAASATSPSDLERSVVVNATMSIVAVHVDAAADKVDALASPDGGRIDGDQRSSRGADRTATLILRILPARMDAVIAAVDTLGTEKARTLRREDVTTSKADIDARVAALSTSVTRLQHLLSTASGVGTLLQVEKVLTARESDLSSLRAQQRALNDEVSLATLTVTITTKAKAAVLVKHHHRFRATGFLAAVDSSVDGLGVTATVVIAALGYVLPVLLPIGLVAAVVFGVRRRRRGSSGPSDEPVAT